MEHIDCSDYSTRLLSSLVGKSNIARARNCSDIKIVNSDMLSACQTWLLAQVLMFVYPLNSHDHGIYKKSSSTVKKETAVALFDEGGSIFSVPPK